jgi:hypothetical protein
MVMGSHKPRELGGEERDGYKQMVIGSHKPKEVGGVHRDMDTSIW